MSLRIGLGETPAAHTNMSAGITSPSLQCTPPSALAITLAPSLNLELTLPELFLRVEAKRLVQFRKDHLSTVDQDNAKCSLVPFD
jgi:hypothetical protein